ncbi:winged helix-turn-helix domain-containing protein [Pragia fontium]|uniref:winged helix-turn-helix domain-containing protein n=1 Tax=Pragia fontium TaxID=82985 RepID=UPI00064A2795|nr:winged helix-turn-helix domain-containing protein [Pragia fontium]AKJ41379.1 hypothetical protein QQ39_04225 [Pragia fontium]VEJ54093.1 Transcriptional regulatory protein, C terminal [Pragia fontium]
MEKSYLINNTILFYPERSLLVSRDDSSSAVTLNMPASMCFLLLIERQNGVVTQREFFKEVWENHGSYVTANTFYQNISILRKGLKAVGLQEELIKTVPKIGLTLSKSVSVVAYEGGHDTHVAEPVSTVESVVSSPMLPQSNMIVGRRFLWLLTCCAVFIFFGLSWWSYSSYIGEGEYFSDYQYLDKIGDCTFYARGKNTNNYITFIQENKVTCPPGHFSYLTIYRTTPRVSVITCDKAISTHGVYCESKYYMKAEDDN